MININIFKREIPKNVPSEKKIEQIITMVMHTYQCAITESKSLKVRKEPFETKKPCKITNYNHFKMLSQNQVA